MKFLRIFGLFALLIGADFGFAFGEPYYTFILNDQGGSGGKVYENYSGALDLGTEFGYLDNGNKFFSLTQIQTIPTPPANSYSHFRGYYTEPNGQGTVIVTTQGHFSTSEDALMSIIANGTQIYANWAPNFYRLTLDDQGGSGGQAASSNFFGLFERYGNCYFLASILNNTELESAACATQIYQAPTRMGYNFDGYYTGTNGTGVRIVNNNKDITGPNTQFTSDSTIYAKWTPKVFTVTLNHQSPTNSPAPSTVYLKYATNWYSNPAATTQISSMTTVPTKTNYDFGGYWTGTNGSGIQVINSNGNFLTTQEVLTAITSNTTIYAKWTAAAPAVYTVTLNSNGGSGNHAIYYSNGNYYCDTSATQVINSNANVFTTCGFSAPTLTNNNFNGYYSNASNGTQYVGTDGKLTVAAQNLNINTNTTWYAHYATCESTIVLEMNGGTLPVGCSSELLPVQNGTNWEFPTIPSTCIPTRDGYTFNGYMYNSDLIYDNRLNALPTNYGYCDIDKLVLTAQWLGVCNEITFDDNNGASQNVNQSVHKSTGDSAWKDSYCKSTITPSLIQPTNDHATFLGYYTEQAQNQGMQIIDANGTATDYGNSWTVSGRATLYAHWQCDTNYVWNETTHACEQNTASVTYKCYVGDSGKIDNEVTLTNYAVRSLSWYGACNINNNNPVPDYKWHFSGDGYDYNADDIIPSWTYGNDKTFTPAYTATFKCNNDYWQAPTGVSVPTAQSVLLGGTLTMPNMPCEVRPEYDGWLETNYTWKTSYTQNLTSPVPGAQCQISDLHYEPGNPFPWNCPTDLTFEPLTKFINKPITVSCGGGSESETYTMTFENQDEIRQEIIYFFNHSCGGHCPLDNPSGPHGYNNKIVCATDWGNQSIPSSWVRIENDNQGRICYKTPADTNVQLILNEISLAQITDLGISNITHCPQRVTYKCSEDATDGYNGAPFAVFEREYTTQTPETVGCESGLSFDTWKNLDDNRTFDDGVTVDAWPYEDPVILVAQWGGANTYNITYANMANATGSQTGMPNTYTFGTGATIDGVPTREHSTFAGWCTESTLTSCAPTQTISPTETGDKTFWANWECEHPYHIDPDTGACAVCNDDQYWDEEANICSNCPTEFKHSKSGFNWSIDQCYRECPSNTLLGDANHRCDSNPNLWDMELCTVTSFEDFQNSTGKQIEFKGNSDAGINTCNNPDNVYCPRGFMRCPSAQPYKPMTTRVDFYGGLDGQTRVGTRYIFGSRQSGEGLNIINGKLWSSLDGPAQKVELNGSPNYYYTHIIYPAETAPDATVQGYTFNGYYYPRSGGTRYVESDYGLNGQNAASVLNGQPGDYSQPRNLYATLDNGGYTANEYNVTYNCGTGNPPAPESQNGIHYGDSVTPRANTCTKPGYNFQGWIVSNTADIKQPGVAFTWQYEEDKVFTAKWSDDPNTYVITYTPGYTGSGQSNVTQNITFGTQFRTQGRIFTRTGHIMTGWSEPFPLLNNTYTYNVAGDTTLNAQWQICPDGTQPNEMGTECEPCANNEAGVGGVCNPCPDGMQPNADHTACVPCADNEAGVGGVCNPCPDGTQPNANHTACVPCPEGTAGTGGTCEPCPDGTQPNEAGTACEPCPEGEAGLGGICNPCPAGTQPNATGTACEPCPDGQYSVNGVCMPCPDGYQPNASGDGCEPCPAGTYGTGGTCEPCPEGYSSNPGATSIDQCFVSDCPTGQHIAHGACEDDVIGCDAPYAATATRTWNSTLGAYGSCQIQECEDGYHVASNACVPNDQLCNVANGRGEREWNGTQWGNCVVRECDPGFEPNAAYTACERCDNYMGADGQPAVSSYIAGCEIATCMYQGQKYAFENGECRPICETASDDTGSKHWDNTTKKCVRTCNPGYKMW